MFKSAIYWVCVFVLRLAELLLHFLREGGALGDFPSFVARNYRGLNFWWSRSG